MDELSSLKLHYKTIYDKDTPFVTRYGTTDERDIWRQGGNDIVHATDKSTLTRMADVMGKIRADIHGRNENDTGYRLFYLQHGPQTLEDIENNLGSEIATVVKNLRLMKK